MNLGGRGEGQIGEVKAAHGPGAEAVSVLLTGQCAIRRCPRGLLLTPGPLSDHSHHQQEAGAESGDHAEAVTGCGGLSHHCDAGRATCAANTVEWGRPEPSWPHSGPGFDLTHLRAPSHFPHTSLWLVAEEEIPILIGGQFAL